MTVASCSGVGESTLCWTYSSGTVQDLHLIPSSHPKVTKSVAKVRKFFAMPDGKSQVGYCSVNIKKNLMFV